MNIPACRSALLASNKLSHEKVPFPASFGRHRAFHRELRAREKFSKAVQVYLAAEKRLQTLRTRLTEFEEILRNGRGRTFRAADQVSFLAALKEETVRATKTEAEVANARQELEIARQAWLESRRDVRVIEKFGEQSASLHRQQSRARGTSGDG